MIHYSLLILSILILASSCNKEKDVSLCEDEDICDVRLYPNPVFDTLNVSFRSDKVAALNLSLIDLNGRIELQQTIKAGTGENKLEVVMSGVKAGLYLIRLKEEESAFEITKKIIKQN